VPGQDQDYCNVHITAQNVCVDTHPHICLLQIWAYATFGYKPTPESLIDELEAAALRILPTFSCQNISNTMWCVRLNLGYCYQRRFSTWMSFQFGETPNRQQPPVVR